MRCQHGVKADAWLPQYPIINALLCCPCSNDQANLDAAARFEAVAAALRRGEAMPGLLPQAPAGPGEAFNPLTSWTAPPPACMHTCIFRIARPLPAG